MDGGTKESSESRSSDMYPSSKTKQSSDITDMWKKINRSFFFLSSNTSILNFSGQLSFDPD